MAKTSKQYKAWSDALFKAFVEGDVDKQADLWAEDCTHTAIDSFGDHHVKKGRAVMRKDAEAWAAGVKNLRLLKNQVLGVGDGKGIGNAEVRWTSGDGKEWACNFVYIITLDGDNRCASYTEWNVVKSREQ